MNKRSRYISVFAALGCMAVLVVPASGTKLPAGSADMPSRPEGAGPASASLSSSFADLTDDLLWREVQASGGSAIVGLKAPDAATGVSNGVVVIEPQAWATAKDAVIAQPGVSLLGADDVRPNVTVRFDDAVVLSKVRSLPHVEFVEPRSFRGQILAPGAGCTGNNYNFDPEGGDVYGGLPATVTPGDKLPNNYRNSRIPEAWARGTTAGAGVTVGVVDTGVFSTQEQLQQAQFSSGSNTNRSIVHLNTSGSSSLWDECNHGTRIASTIAAPRDGISMVGVAWRANIVSVKHGNDVAVDGWETDAVTRGIRAAVDNGARIIEMAFGTGSWEFTNIKQEIHFQHGRGVLFVGAAGSTYCAEGVTFPAKMPEVLAVTGVTASGQLHPEACGGPQVDAAVVIDDTFASGRRTGDIITMGGSSGASAVAAGIAALVWAENPWLTRDQVRDRVVFSGNWCCTSGIGSGIIDAYKAIGGFASLSISAPTPVYEYQSYTLTAAPRGNGPFTYRWSNGATTKSITVTAGAAGTTKSHSVTVTDTRENKSLSATRSVTAKAMVYEDTCPPPPMSCQ